MDHLKDYWFHELREMREALISKEEKIILTFHTENERMGERKIEVIEIAEAILTGTILEGWDTSQYPKFRNPDPLRTIVGKTSSGKILSVGVALCPKGTFRVTTVYEGVTNRLMENFEKECPEWYSEYASVNEDSVGVMN